MYNVSLANCFPMQIFDRYRGKRVPVWISFSPEMSLTYGLPCKFCKNVFWQACQDRTDTVWYMSIWVWFCVWFLLPHWEMKVHSFEVNAASIILCTNFIDFFTLVLFSDLRHGYKKKKTNICRELFFHGLILFTFLIIVHYCRQKYILH